MQDEQEFEDAVQQEWGPNPVNWTPQGHYRRPDTEGASAYTTSTPNRMGGYARGGARRDLD